MTSLLEWYPSASVLGFARSVSLSEGVAWRAAVDTVHSEGPLMSLLGFGQHLNVVRGGTHFGSLILTVVVPACVCLFRLRLWR